MQNHYTHKLSDEFYTVVINEGFIHKDVCKFTTDNIADAIRFYSKKDAEHYADDLRKERNPQVILVTCKYEIEEIQRRV